MAVIFSDKGSQKTYCLVTVEIIRDTRLKHPQQMTGNKEKNWSFPLYVVVYKKIYIYSEHFEIAENKTTWTFYPQVKVGHL